MGCEHCLNLKETAKPNIDNKAGCQQRISNTPRGLISPRWESGVGRIVYARTVVANIKPTFVHIFR